MCASTIQWVIIRIMLNSSSMRSHWHERTNQITQEPCAKISNENVALRSENSKLKDLLRSKEEQLNLSHLSSFLCSSSSNLFLGPPLFLSWIRAGKKKVSCFVWCCWTFFSIRPWKSLAWFEIRSFYVRSSHCWVPSPLGLPHGQTGWQTSASFKDCTSFFSFLSSSTNSS